MNKNINCQTAASDNKSSIETHKIYRFNDLSFGKLCSVNREIRKPHVRKILRGLEEGTWNRLQQITVDIDTFEIVDGNHRFMALSWYYDKYGSFNNNLIDVVYYKRNPNETLADAIKFYNDDRKPVNSKDYTHISEANGNKAIPLIKKFGMEHPLLAKINKNGEIKGFYERYTYALLYGKNITKEVKNGSIEIDDEILKQGEILYNEIEQMILLCNLKIGTWFEQFIQSWYHCRVNDRLFINQFKKIDFSEFVEQIAEDSKEWSMDKTTKGDWQIRFSSTMANLVD